jgi:hypothetical protein
VRTVSRDAVVRPDHRVRRRRYGEQAFLIRHLEYFALDGMSDTVWRGCERALPVGEVVALVAREHALPLDEALAATVLALERFRALALVHYGREADGATAGAP